MIKARTTLVASLILVPLLAFVLWDLATRWQRQAAKQNERALLAGEGKLVEWVEIGAGEGRGRPTVRLECREAGGGCSLASNTKWEITAPERTDADSLQIGSFLASLGSVGYEEKIPLDAALRARDWRGEFGLKSPRVTVAIQIRGESAPVRFEFGDAAMVGSSHYALSSRVPDSVLSVPVYLVKAIDRDFFHWRAKQLFPEADPEAVTEMAWTHAQLGGKFRLERKGEDWWITSPKEGRAEFLAANGLVSGLAALTARAIADPSTKLAAQPTLVAEFQSKDGRARKLTVFPAHDKTKFIARSSERAWTAEVQAEEVSRFVRSFPELRDTQLLSRGESARAARFEFEYFVRGAGGGRAPVKGALIKSGDAWRMDPAADAGTLREDRIALLAGAFAAPEVAAHSPAEGKAFAAWKKDYNLVARFLDEKKEVVKEFRVWVESKDVAYADGEGPKEIRRLSGRFAKTILELTSEAPVSNAIPAPGNHEGHEHAH